jgi:hypothetical protein
MMGGTLGYGERDGVKGDGRLLGDDSSGTWSILRRLGKDEKPGAGV